MAKKPSPRKATPTPGRPTADDTHAAGPIADSPQRPASTDRELLEESEDSRLIRTLFNNAFGGQLKPLRDVQNEILEQLQKFNDKVALLSEEQREIRDQVKKLAEGPIRRTDESLTDLHHKFDSRPKSPAPETVEELAQKRCRELILMEQRKSLWVLEKRSPERADSTHHMPRSSLIGRALHDLGAFTEHQGQHSGDIFTRLKKSGTHHLSPLIQSYLDKYIKPDGSKDTAVSGDLGNQLKPRIEPLIRLGYAGKGSKGHFLTPQGRQVFDGWPDYEAGNNNDNCGGKRTP